LIVLGAGAVVCFGCLPGYTAEAVRHLLYQVGQGGKGGTHFPYFLVPAGLSTLWGLLPLGGSASEPWLSASIWLAAQLLLAAVPAAVWLPCRRHAATALCLVMFGLAVLLFRDQAGFGLFKLAMFIQPFLIAVVVTAWVRLFGRTPRQAAP